MSGEAKSEIPEIVHWYDNLLGYSIGATRMGRFELWDPMKGEKIPNGSFETLRAAREWIEAQVSASNKLARDSQPVFNAFQIYDLGSQVQLKQVKVKGYHGGTGALKLEARDGTTFTDKGYSLQFARPADVSVEILNLVDLIKAKSEELGSLVETFKTTPAWQNRIQLRGELMNGGRPNPVRLLEANAELAERFTAKGFDRAD
jgi:hypothetical protein